MTFTNNDLKRLEDEYRQAKDDIQNNRTNGMWNYNTWTGDIDRHFLVLLARLEAAELVGATAHAYIHSPSEITKENYYKTEEAWRKAAGK